MKTRYMAALLAGTALTVAGEANAAVIDAFAETQLNAIIRLGQPLAVPNGVG